MVARPRNHCQQQPQSLSRRVLCRCAQHPTQVSTYFQQITRNQMQCWRRTCGNRFGPSAASNTEAPQHVIGSTTSRYTMLADVTPLNSGVRRSFRPSPYTVSTPFASSVATTIVEDQPSTTAPGPRFVDLVKRSVWRGRSHAHHQNPEVLILRPLVVPTVRKVVNV